MDRLELSQQADSPKSSRATGESSRDPALLSGRLLVDDDSDFRRVVGLRMESVGHRCQLRGTKADALRLLSRYPDIMERREHFRALAWIGSC